MEPAEVSLLLRRRLCDPSYIHSIFKYSPDGNYSKLKFIIFNSINEPCNNSVLLLGPHGSGKSAVLELVLEDLKVEHPGIISVVRLNGLLHGDNNNGLKEIARQLCLEYHLPFSKMASSDENSELLIDILRECGLAHKTVIFTLEEFDLFTQVFTASQGQHILNKMPKFKLALSTFDIAYTMGSMGYGVCHSLWGEDIVYTVGKAASTILLVRCHAVSYFTSCSYWSELSLE